MNALIKAVELKVPVALVNEEAARLANEMKQNFVNQGMTDAANLDLPLDMFKEQAERRVSLGLILVNWLTKTNWNRLKSKSKPLSPTSQKATKILKK